jgi:ribA/ribD-fused uncharacterized protein
MKDKSYAGFFLEGWYVFDNFSAFQIEWRGKLYPTAEHAYQAAHFIETAPEIAEKVRNLKSPREASDFANENSALDDPIWKQKRLDIMREIIRCKLDQHEYVRQKLIESADMNIVEMNDNDGFWGWGKRHDGANNLGKIWMELRSEILQ